MYGVPFKEAVEIARHREFMKSEFYLPDEGRGLLHPTLLLHLNKRKESNNGVLELQVWQYCPEQEVVFYLHAESPDFETHATHLDGSVLHYAKADLRELFQKGRKLKAQHKEKQFQIDGEIPLDDMYAIASLYLPVEELTHEAFEVRSVDLNGSVKVERHSGSDRGKQQSETKTATEEGNLRAPGSSRPAVGDSRPS